MKEFLGIQGLTYLWTKIKAYVSSRLADYPTKSEMTSAIKVTGVKGSVETSYRTGNVSLSYSDVGAVQAGKAVEYGGVLMPTNPHGGKKLYINSIDDAFYAADKRFYVTATKHKKVVDGVTYPYIDTSKTVEDDDYFVDSPVAGNLIASQLFDGSYDSRIQCAADEYMKVKIMFGTNTSPSATTSYFTGYPYGSYYLSYFNEAVPDTPSQCRIYNKYAPRQIGWHLLTASVFQGTLGNRHLTEVISDNVLYQRSCVEFIIFGNENLPQTGTGLVQIDYQLTRPTLSRDGSTVTKFGTQSLYYPFEWYYNHAKTITIDPSGIFTGTKFVKSGGTSAQFLKADGSVDNTAYLPANGTAANATKANQDGSGNVIETTYQKIADIPAAITASEMDAVLGEESEETNENTNE